MKWIYVRFRWLETIEDVSPIQSKASPGSNCEAQLNDRGSRTLGVLPHGPTYHPISTTSTKVFDYLSTMWRITANERRERPSGRGGRKGGADAALRLQRHGVWSPPSAANSSQCQLTVRILSVGKARCFANRGLDPRSNLPREVCLILNFACRTDHTNE